MGGAPQGRLVTTPPRRCRQATCAAETVEMGKLEGERIREQQILLTPGAYEPPKAARSVQLRRTAFAFTRI